MLPLLPLESKQSPIQSLHDTLLDNAFTGNSLDWWRLDRDMHEHSVSWSVSISAVPEPASLALIGLIGLGYASARRRGSR